MENEFMDQFLENRQNYMMDNNSIQQLNVASAGDGVVGGVQAEVVSGVAGEILGGKYDEHEEHDVGDDDETKYVEEVQQSEKQQQQQLQALKNIGLDDDGTCESNELAEKETSNNAVHEFGNGNGGFVFGGDHHSREQQQQHDLFNIGNGHDTNGHDTVNIIDDFNTIVSTGFEEKLNMMESDLDGFKNEADFSSISNVTESAEGFVPQVDVKIETKVEQHELVDEEEPSSLATNTTNGTSSLSENIPAQANVDSQANALDDLMISLEDKENSDPHHTSQRPTDLDLELAQSQLNPDAKEFVPSFGSNPASPTSPFATEALQTEPVLSEIMEAQMYFGQAPVVAPRHLQEDDDFVAQSPCKGKDDNNMDTVFVPRELSEFEIEADKRPHELEPEVIEGFTQRDEVMTPDQAIQQLPLDDVEIENKENQATTDSTDFQSSSFIDHGPETCVDHEIDLDMPKSSLQVDDDVMKRSMYVASDDAIEDVLNSVQPIPTEIDSVNNSFMEEPATEYAANQLAGDKELLQVEEKEHVSHSPSTEEIQMTLHNNLNSSNKDIPQIPIDMQESLFMAEELNSQLEEQIEKDSSKNPFDMQEMLSDQQQTIAEEMVEQTFFQKELEADNTTLLDTQVLLEENEIKEKPNEIDEQQQQQQHVQDENQMQEELNSAPEEKRQIEEMNPEENQILEEHYEIEEKQQNEETCSEGNQYEIQEPHHVEEISGKSPEVNEIKEIYEEEHIEKTSGALEGNQFREGQYELDEKQHIVETVEDQKHCDLLLLKDQMENTYPKELSSITAPGTDNVLEQQIELNESFSPFKITDDVSNTMDLESLNNEIPDNLQKPDITNTHTFESLNNNESPANLQQADFIDVDMTAPESLTGNENPLLEETKEQQLFSISGLEQQMSEMMLNNTDGNLSQAEEVAITAATSVIEDISENLTNADEAIDLDEQYQHHQEREQTEQLTLVDDSFNRHEEESLQQYLQEQEQKEQEMAAETEIKSNLIQESLETPAAQQHQHQEELESEIVAVEEPLIEAQQVTTLLTHEETEIKTEEKHALPTTCTTMVPETGPAEVLEPTMATNTKAEIETETEMAKKQEEISEPSAASGPSEDVKTDIVKEPELEEQKEILAEALKEDVVAKEEISAEIPTEAAIAAAAVAVVTATAVAAKTASSPSAKKPLTKTTTTTAAKSKVAPITAAKKPTEAAKKPIGPAAKPRTVPAKPTGVNLAEKKTPLSTGNRKPTTTSKVLAKTATTTSTARTLTAAPKPTTTSSKPAATPRTVPSSTLTARKPATATNGSLAKPRPASAPTKPTTLGLSATNGAPKTKPLSPRSTLTSQVRKTNPPTTLASRTKVTPSTASSTAGPATKTFSARPAPKFTSSSSATTTTTTTRRSVAAGSTTSSTTAASLKPSTTALRKSTPTKPVATKTPTKSATTAGGLKSKSPASKTASPAAKPAPIRKPVDKTTIAATNGEANADNKQLNGLSEQQLNGDMQAVQQEKQQNGDSSIPMQTENLEQPFLETRYEKLPMDLINA